MDLEQLEKDGFVIVPKLFDELQLWHIQAVLERDIAQCGIRRGGTRDVFNHLPSLRYLAETANLLPIVSEVLGMEAFLVRATLFDKTPEANWKVPWHQDVTIAVKERHDSPGYGPWSVKRGVPHVQPPSAVLEKMLTVRIHLDPCPETNGALRVILGSHRLGRLNQNVIGPHIDESLSRCCALDAGDALVMRPLLLHSSSASTTPGHRRVLPDPATLRTLAEDVLAGRFNIPIDRMLPLEKAAEAHVAAEKGGIGKVLLLA
jgi:ectoine hydroxylase-related dioxygenase (phytanoyl-CoA dioxygenase family)